MTVTTVLLDLDNTLLGNNMAEFLPPYFAGLTQYLGELANGQDLRQLMSASVRAALANQDPTVTNMAAFMADFTQRLGQPIEIIQPLIEAFYREAYPHLRQYTTFRGEAQQVVQRLLADGYQVVIATNPLFPATAIEQRLEWAGLNGLPYALVTTMENSYFCKPNPRYYQEILAQLGSAPAATWMVGDDPENDIAPARAVGLKTWWVTNPDLPEPPVKPTCDKQGSLADFLAWVEAGGLAGA